MSTQSNPPPTIDAHVTISNAVTIPLNLAMSTSFQPAEWDNQFFTLNPSSTTSLGNLLPQHIRLQGVSQGVPQTSPASWDFSTLDAITQPVLSLGDHSPEFQIAVAPAFMYDAQHNFLDPTYQAVRRLRARSRPLLQQRRLHRSRRHSRLAQFRIPSLGGASTTSPTSIISTPRSTRICTTQSYPCCKRWTPTLNSRPWNWEIIPGWPNRICPLSSAE